MSVNKAMILGNLGRDPELRYTPGGQAVCQFSVATSRNFKDREGNWQEDTEWHSVVIWGQAGERAAERLRKGSKVYVEGRMTTRSWDDPKSGEKKYKTEVIADRFESLDPRAPGESTGGDSDAPAAASRSRGNSAKSEYDDMEDLPF